MNRRGFLLGMAGILAAQQAPALLVRGVPTGWTRTRHSWLLTSEIGRYENVRIIYPQAGISIARLLELMRTARASVVDSDANGNYAVWVPTSQYADPLLARREFDVPRGTILSDSVRKALK